MRGLTNSRLTGGDSEGNSLDAASTPSECSSIVLRVCVGPEIVDSDALHIRGLCAQHNEVQIPRGEARPFNLLPVI